MSFATSSFMGRCCGPENPCGCAGGGGRTKSLKQIEAEYPDNPVALVEAWWDCRLKGDATATAHYCTDDVECVLSAWSTPLKGINAVKQEVFSKPAPPLRPENLIAPFRVAPEMAEAPGTTTVVRDVKVRLGFAVFQVRQQWTIIGAASARPKIMRMAVTKL